MRDGEANSALNQRGNEIVKLLAVISPASPQR